MLGGSKTRPLAPVEDFPDAGASEKKEAICVRKPSDDWCCVTLLRVSGVDKMKTEKNNLRGGGGGGGGGEGGGGGGVGRGGGGGGGGEE